MNYVINNFNLPKVNQLQSNFNQPWHFQISKVAIILDLLEIWKMNLQLWRGYKHQILEAGKTLKKIPYGTPPQDVLTLPDNDLALTNLYNSSCGGVTYTIFRQKVQGLNRIHKALLRRCQWPHYPLITWPSYGGLRNIYTMEGLSSSTQTLKSSSSLLNKV